MTIGASIAFYDSIREKLVETNNPHKVAEIVGISAMALAFIGGVITVAALSICGALGMGPFNQLLTFKANIAICGTLGGIEVLTVLCLALRALGYGKEKDGYVHVKD